MVRDPARTFCGTLGRWRAVGKWAVVPPRPGHRGLRVSGSLASACGATCGIDARAAPGIATPRWDSGNRGAGDRLYAVHRTGPVPLGQRSGAYGHTVGNCPVSTLFRGLQVLANWPLRRRRCRTVDQMATVILCTTAWEQRVMHKCRWRLLVWSRCCHQCRPLLQLGKRPLDSASWTRRKFRVRLRPRGQLARIGTRLVYEDDTED